MVGAESYEIQLLPPTKVDKALWDKIVLQSTNGSFFAAYDYLQQMAPAWQGLVIGAYEAVLPLIYKTKYGIRYLTTLPFVRQLGLIGQLPVQMQTHAGYAAIFEKIHDFARYGDISFNHSNQAALSDAGLGQAIKELPNFELNLNKPYGHLAGGYQKSLQGKIRRLEKKAALEWQPADSHDVINAYQDLLAKKAGLDLKVDFKRLHLLVDDDFGNAHFTAYQVKEKDSKGQALLYGIYGKDKYRVYKFMTAASPAGRKQQAGVFALDKLIAMHAGTDYKLDFMGSGLMGVRSFIESFGAINQPYFLYHYNHLPWPISLAKK